MSMKNSYWNNNGKYQAELDKLNKLMPDFEYTDNAYMNLFITISQIYYKTYNDGCSFSDFENKVNEYIYPFENEINFNSYQDYKGEELEELVNRVIMFIKDKDLNYAQFAAYVNHNAKQVSWTEKEGFRKVTSGAEKYIKDWVESFSGFGYQLV